MIPAGFAWGTGSLAGSSILNLGDATPPDATLPDAAMASPPDHSPVASPKTDEAFHASYASKSLQLSDRLLTSLLMTSLLRTDRDDADSVSASFSLFLFQEGSEKPVDCSFF